LGGGLNRVWIDPEDNDREKVVRSLAKKPGFSRYEPFVVTCGG
jgi:hypothetical protein